MKRVDRLIIGERGADFGFWMSKPGVDVKTASPDDLLISTSDDFSNLSFLAHYYVSAGKGSTFGEYGDNFSEIPLVLPQLFKKERVLVPSLQTGFNIINVLDKPPRFSIEMSRSGFEIVNLIDIRFDLQLLVLGIGL